MAQEPEPKQFTVQALPAQLTPCWQLALAQPIWHEEAALQSTATLLQLLAAQSTLHGMPLGHCGEQAAPLHAMTRRLARQDESPADARQTRSTVIGTRRIISL